MASRTWETNADEYRLLTKQGINVRLAVLVACSVNRPATKPRSGKITVTEFARHVGTTPERVMRHLAAWDACAKDGMCQSSSSLSPVDAGQATLRVPEEAEFVRRFDASKSGGRPRAPIAEVLDRVGSDRDWAERMVRAATQSFPDLIPVREVPAVCEHPETASETTDVPGAIGLPEAWGSPVTRNPVPRVRQYGSNLTVEVERFAESLTALIDKVERSQDSELRQRLFTVLSNGIVSLRETEMV